jgi:hypothetical protein
MRRRRVDLALVASTALTAMCARSAPVRIGVLFDTSWRCAGQVLPVADRDVIKQSALRSLRLAFQMFNLQIDEGTAGDRLIRVEDTSYGSISEFGAAGMTSPVSAISSVRFDVLCSAELALVHCPDLSTCDARPRRELLEGLGRGVGATAAHEVGHQAGLHFAFDSRCDDCYDGASATTIIHFFGTKHWSDEALARMRRVLPVAK